MGTFTWTITPNDIDREIKVWKDRKSGKLKNGWDFLAFNYDAEQIINVLNYAKGLNKSVLITSSYLFWKADVIYDNREDKLEKKKNCDDKKQIAIILRSLDQSINFPLICKGSDIFQDVIKKLYDEYPDLKYKIIYFLHNGTIIDNYSATLDEIKIKNADNILFNTN